MKKERKILKFKEYNLIRENSEFNQYQLGLPGVSTLPNYGFAMQPDFSIYGNNDGKYVDFYSRQSAYMSHLLQVIKDVQGGDLYRTDISYRKIDTFLEDIDKFDNLKILRIFKNELNLIDVYISFTFDEEEFFGVYKKFNGLTKPLIKTEFFTTVTLGYFDEKYFLKFNNYLYKILYNWFIPSKGIYKNLKIDNTLRDDFGKVITIKKGVLVEVMGYNKEMDNKLYIIVKYNNNIYYIDNNDFYFFNYYFEKI
jgi:hypothetical protein